MAREAIVKGMELEVFRWLIPGKIGQKIRPPDNSDSERGR